MNQIIVGLLFLTVALAATDGPSETESYLDSTESVQYVNGNDARGRGGSPRRGRGGTGGAAPVGSVVCHDVEPQGCRTLYCAKPSCTLTISDGDNHDSVTIHFGSVLICCPDGACRMCM